MQVETHNRVAKFDGRFQHWNAAPSCDGDRYSAVFYIADGPARPRIMLSPRKTMMSFFNPKEQALKAKN